MIRIGKSVWKMLEFHSRDQLGDIQFRPRPEVPEHGGVFGGMSSDQDAICFGTTMPVAQEVTGEAREIPGNAFYAESTERIMIGVHQAAASF